jgi:nucleotide-binding universal stress UspA family protein
MVNLHSNTILVPWDFTEVAGYALEHALVIAKNSDNEIALVHIIKHEKQFDEANKKLIQIAEETTKKHKITTNAYIRKGSIFNTISDVATELEANLVIMGTHGIKGMQKLTGSWALKVIVSVSEKIPFIVVQAPPQNNKFERIVFPVDVRKETREKLNWVRYLSKYYNVKIDIFKRADAALRRGIEENIVFTRKYLKSHNIDYEISTEEGKKPFPIETLNFAQKINADLILIMTTKNIGFADYVMGPDEQYIIANSAKIPVMCVNPKPPTYASAGYAAGSGI